MHPVIQAIKGKLIVSVQAYPGEPLRTPEVMALMSRACELGGARHLSGRVEKTVGTLRYGSRNLRMDEASVQRLRILLPGMNPQEVAGLKPLAVAHCDGLRVSLSGPAWLLVRPSRAYSVVRASAEAPTEDLLADLLAQAPILCSARP